MPVASAISIQTPKTLIKERARELGFDDCRVTTAEPPASVNHLERWLAEGKNGEMGYMLRNAPKRADLKKVLHEARSVITLAVSYQGKNPADQNESKPPINESAPNGIRNPQHAGVIARYARFDDYHDVIGKQLGQLTEFINEREPGTRSLWYVDTGPILERDLAQRAGLGFIGKHTNLISKSLGNWIFLSEIITTLELEPDEPEKNHCGSCSRCLSACPTNAITAPFQLDARRCISYLTIELKGPIPLELRPLLGNRIYGCDDCLEACPWNRFARQGAVMERHERKDLRAPDLLELLTLDEPAFKARFAGTPMLRTKRHGFLRNVCVALGNIGDESSLPALERAAADSEPLVAEHARWAIEQIKGRVEAHGIREASAKSRN